MINRDIMCPFCSDKRTRLFFHEGETDASGYRCTECGCVFIIMKAGKEPPCEDDDDEEHARDVWPYRGLNGRSAFGDS